MNIKEIVSDLVEQYNTRNPFTLADYLDIIVREDDLGKTSGYYLNYHDIQCICINTSLPEHLKSTVMAHELGHAILHKGLECMFFKNTFFNKNKQEIEANCFAAELLIPDSVIYDNPGMTKDQLAILTGYNKKLIDYKKI